MSAQVLHLQFCFRKVHTILCFRILHALYIFHTWCQVEAGVYVWFHTCWRPWLDSEHEQENFLDFWISRSTLRPTQTLIQEVRGAISPVMKQSGRWTERSPISSAEVKNEWNVTSLPHTSSWRAQAEKWISPWAAVTMKPQIRLCRFTKHVYDTSRLTTRGRCGGVADLEVKGILFWVMLLLQWNSPFVSWRYSHVGYIYNGRNCIFRFFWRGRRNGITDVRDCGGWRDWARVSIVQRKFCLRGREDGASYSLQCAACKWQATLSYVNIRICQAVTNNAVSDEQTKKLQVKKKRRWQKKHTYFS